MHGRYSRSVGAPVNLNVQRVGPNARPQSNSPARLTCMTAVASPNTRRYSPPSGSVSSTKSPESTPRTSWDHTHNAAPLSTSSPRVARRGQPGGGPRAPYYVADTQSKQQPAYFIDEGINTSGGSGGSSSGSVFVPNFAPKIGVEPGGVLPHDTSLGASFASDNFQSVSTRAYLDLLFSLRWPFTETDTSKRITKIQGGSECVAFGILLFCISILDSLILNMFCAQAWISSRALRSPKS